MGKAGITFQRRQEQWAFSVRGGLKQSGVKKACLHSGECSLLTQPVSLGKKSAGRSEASLRTMEETADF